MTQRCTSHLRPCLTASILSRSWRRLSSLALLAAVAGGCGGESTDAGDPSDALGRKLELAASATGVVVSGDPGAAPGGARVDVVNTATGQLATTTAAEDGSFELELEGSVADEYRVYTASAGESWRTRLTSSGAADAEAGLAGLQFLLSSVDGAAPVAGVTMRLSFEASELSFSAGCNSYFGAYSQCDGKLCVSELGGTEIGCDAPLHARDEWLADFMQSSPALTQAGATLTLAGAGVKLEFLDREVADADRPLTGRTWTVDTFIEGDAASNFPLQTAATIQFGADGSLTVYTTCNTGSGSYTLSGQTLTLASVAYAEEVCDPTGSAAAQERITRVLTDGDVRFEIDAGRLTLMRGERGLSATTE